MEILTMGTTIRHMEILDWFSGFSNEKKKQDPKFKTGREQIALVDNGGELIDVSALTELGIQYIKDQMGKFGYSYPDFMIFKDNPVIISDNKTRYAGMPDLIIEVWSKSNKKEEKEQKRNLYRTNKSEFWELDQDSPKILCWHKDGQMYEQHMDQPVKTPWGETLDLTELADDVVDILPNDRFSGGPIIGQKIDLSEFKK